MNLIHNDTWQVVSVITLTSLYTDDDNLSRMINAYAAAED